MAMFANNSTLNFTKVSAALQ